MKLTLRPEWRLYPLSSFLGVLDLKTGVIVALLFALLNKVAGVYGLIAALTGAGGSFAQISLYLYSTLALVAIALGLKAVKREDAKQTLYFAHFFFFDHALSTAWVIWFAIVWWVKTPHDGRRQAHSAAQEAMMHAAPPHEPMTDAQRVAAAMTIWEQEKGFAAAIIAMSWLSKFYFALLIYSYASHLRKGSYRALPLSRSTPVLSAQVPSHYENGAALYDDTALGLGEDEDGVDDFYRVPLRTPVSRGGMASGNGLASGNGTPNGRATTPLSRNVTPNGHKPGQGSTSSLADFVGAPRGKSGLGNGNGEVVFDAEERR
ncbi:Inositolphosphorylceramide synthase subunit Kei1-domain-containing protein [Schizophyllum commune]